MKVDSCHEEARRVIAKVISENPSKTKKNIFIPPEIIIEIVNTLKKRADKSVSKEFIKFIETASQISIMPLGSANCFDKAILWYSQQEGSLSMNDLLLVAMATVHNIELLTFDKKLKNFYDSKLKNLNS